VLKARQSAAYNTADDIRVVKLIPEGEEAKVREGELEEVKFNGQEVGEIVIRGNMLMTVSLCCKHLSFSVRQDVSGVLPKSDRHC